jgi:hypothetical protein
MKNPETLSGAFPIDNNLSVVDETKLSQLSEPPALDENTFSEYYALTPYQRQCLPGTNYWREMNGLPIFAVPKTDIHYYTYYKASVKDIYAKLVTTH